MNSDREGDGAEKIALHVRFYSRPRTDEVTCNQLRRYYEKKIIGTRDSYCETRVTHWQNLNTSDFEVNGDFSCAVHDGMKSRLNEE